mmetsp:Transcript_29697/g.98378  ORF Transcript_29697/g.98378 Transcript_29697/m.98378 type:complete len:210 (-) Transcript_29697:358-987(-)
MRPRARTRLRPRADRPRRKQGAACSRGPRPPCLRQWPRPTALVEVLEGRAQDALPPRRSSLRRQRRQNPCGCFCHLCRSQHEGLQTQRQARENPSFTSKTMFRQWLQPEAPATNVQALSKITRHRCRSLPARRSRRRASFCLREDCGRRVCCHPAAEVALQLPPRLHQAARGRPSDSRSTGRNVRWLCQAPRWRCLARRGSPLARVASI